MTPEALRILAATEHGYVASRLVTYREDGAPIPEPIRKLGALADAVLAFLPGLADLRKDETHLAAERDGFKDAYMSAVRSNEMLIKERDAANESLATARKALYDIGSLLGTVNAKLDGSAPCAAQEVAPVSEPAPRTTVEDKIATDALEEAAREGAPRVSTATVVPSPIMGARWPASGLYHGLVLIRADNERRLFAEPIKGQYSVQTVAPDGLTAGEPWSTVPDAWKPEEWNEWDGIDIAAQPSAPRYDAPIAPKAKAEKPPAADRTLSLFVETPAAPAPTAPKAKTIGDFAPDDAQFAKWTSALNDALTKAGKEAIIHEKTRAVFAEWQAAHATEEKPNPAAAAWHGVKSAIVGT